MHMSARITIFLFVTLAAASLVYAQELPTLADKLVAEQLAESILFAPAREHYAPSRESCAFCAQLAEQQDAKHFILARRKNFFIMMNLYPYSRGHLLIIPYKHIPDTLHLSADQQAELMELVNLCMVVLQKVLNPDGMNIGISKGKAAGASIPDHLHMHIVPRWSVADNFFTVIGKTRVIWGDMQGLYKQLKEPFDKET
jgi:ATP adenylyltransferase